MARKPTHPLKQPATTLLTSNRKLPGIPIRHRRIAGHYERHDDVAITFHEIDNDLNCGTSWRNDRGVRSLTGYTAKRSELIREALILAHEDHESAKREFKTQGTIRDRRKRDQPPRVIAGDPKLNDADIRAERDHSGTDREVWLAKTLVDELNVLLIESVESESTARALVAELESTITKQDFSPWTPAT